jgi:hypothetical protein
VHIFHFRDVQCKQTDVWKILEFGHTGDIARGREDKEATLGESERERGANAAVTAAGDEYRFHD